MGFFINRHLCTVVVVRRVKGFTHTIPSKLGKERVSLRREFQSSSSIVMSTLMILLGSKLPMSGCSLNRLQASNEEKMNHWYLYTGMCFRRWTIVASVNTSHTVCWIGSCVRRSDWRRWPSLQSHWVLLSHLLRSTPLVRVCLQLHPTVYRIQWCLVCHLSMPWISPMSSVYSSESGSTTVTRFTYWSMVCEGHPHSNTRYQSFQFHQSIVSSILDVVIVVCWWHHSHKRCLFPRNLLHQDWLNLHL